MGNFRSTRWNRTTTKASTDGLLRLDVHALSRGGVFRPGTRHTVTWGDGNAPGAEILTIIDRFCFSITTTVLASHRLRRSSETCSRRKKYLGRWEALTGT